MSAELRWLALIALPLAAAATTLLARTSGAHADAARARRGVSRAHALLILTSLATSGLALAQTLTPASPRWLGGLLRGDVVAQLFAPVLNLIFLGISVYVRGRGPGAGDAASTRAKRRFTALSLIFLAGANLVVISNHLLLTWLALEATTLAAAVLIAHAEGAAARLASWRYLLFSSIGLGLALLGLGCLARSMAAQGVPPTLLLDALPAALAAPPDPWRQLGVALVLLGLGTKLGLAPMYSWLPEAYDEAPAAVTAMLGAVQFNCTLIFLLHVVQVYRPQSGALITGALLTIGVTSVAVSTVSIVATRSFKRLLAYASINHAGVIAIGLGLGETASFGLLLYVLSNAFIKAILFLTAGKIESHYGTKDTASITGLIKDLPYSGLYLMVATFALLGFPPFGSFLGELLILSALVTSGQLFVFGAFCVMITITFVATGRTIFPMIWAEPRVARTWPRQRLRDGLHKLIFLLALLVLGVYLPPQLNALMTEAAAMLGGR
ncbi:MAG: proton-conducting transporter membrane subunit [Kofleriaceae bacterium]